MRLGVRMYLKPESLLSNVKRQSKRLSKVIGCPLGHAQEGLAICLYGCDSYSDLLKKIKSESFDNPLIALTALSPNSESFLVKLLESHLNTVLENFEKKFSNFDFSEEVVVSLFGLSFEEYQSQISS